MIGRIQNMYAGNPRVKVIAVPDIDPVTGESNFEYEYSGFKKSFSQTNNYLWMIFLIDACISKSQLSVRDYCSRTIKSDAICIYRMESRK